MPTIDAAKLKQARERAILTQEELAQKIGGGVATISRLEQSRNVARPSTIRRLAEALNVRPQDLLADEA